MRFIKVFDIFSSIINISLWATLSTLIGPTCNHGLWTSDSDD